jgi:hypothetical protein
MICLRTLLRIYDKKSNPKKFKNKKVFWLPEATRMTKKNVFLGHNNITKDWNLVKITASRS